MRGDFHTHSTLDDGKSSLEEMAAAARAAGLTHFGFSGHSYCPLEEDYCIHREKIPEYLAPGPGAPGAIRGGDGGLCGAGAGPAGGAAGGPGLCHRLGSFHLRRGRPVFRRGREPGDCAEVRGGALRRGLVPLYRRILRPGGPPAGADGMRLDRAL